MSTAKEYYKSYRANVIFDALNVKLNEVIKGFEPKSLFEFGCGTGKNLTPFLGSGCNVVGLDISYMNMAHCFSNQLPMIILSDETLLPYLDGFDVVFTCSVLDHIPEVGRIIEELKRMSRKAVVLAETNSKQDNYYYPHDYGTLGFKP